MGANLIYGMFQDELGDLLASIDELTPETVAKIIEQHPRFERQIMEYVVERAMWQHTSDNNDLSPNKEERFLEIGRNAALKVLQHKRKELEEKGIRRQEQTQEKILISLIEEAKVQGMNISGFASSTGLSIPIIAKLEQRLIAFASIPKEAIDKIATVIKASSESVASFLQGAPQFASDASYKSETQPELLKQQDFYAAVQSDLTLKPEQKEYWLSLNKE